MSRLDMYEKKAAAQKNALKRTGKYKFIELMLLKGTRSRIQGIDTVRVIEGEDINNPGVPKYEFIESGGRIDFRFDEMKGGKFFDLIDTPRNRKFLASHVGEDIWEITDPVIREEINKMATDVSGEVFYKKKPNDIHDDFEEQSDENEVGDNDGNNVPGKATDVAENVVKKRRGPKRRGAVIIDDSTDS